MTTVPTVTAGATPGNLTQAIWAAFLIEQINAEGGNIPLTLNNVQNIERWMVAEEPAGHWWNRNNPLNASLGTSASDGTGSYPNLSAAAQYTGKMILQSNMSGIYNALKANAPTSVFSAAVVASPWASSHYGGNPNHIAQIPVPSEVSAGTIQSALPADSGVVVPASPTPLGPLGAGVNVGGNLTSWTDALNTLLSDLISPSWWLRVGMGALGIVLFLVGLAGFISTTKPGQKATGEIGPAVKDAAVAAVAA